MFNGRFEKTFDGVEFYGTYSFTKGEKPTMMHPGASTEVFINDIYLKDSDINLIDVIKSDIIEYLEEQIRDNIDGDY